MIVALIGGTLFLSAFLLFWCQPMVAKMVLPLLGGAASVWTTCVLFFQVILLGGYVYAHGISRIKSLRSQTLLHCGVMLSVLLFLPIGFTASPGREAADHPIGWLLVHLLAAVGLPFFAVSTTAPLLQNWLSRTNVESRRDPYFLYSASNAGSLMSLVAFPLWFEPHLGLVDQSRAWWLGYGALLVAVGVVAIAVSRQSVADATPGGGHDPSPALTLRQRGFWLASAFLPSALMLAVTNHISTNLASLPFLWIVPLAVYLGTFIIAFSRRRAGIAGHRMQQLAPFAFLLLLLIVPDIAPLGPTLNWLMLLMHVGVLFFGALLCHTALSNCRPPPRHLTEFYLWIAVGGALGGIFAGLVAPALFKTVFEYPLLVAMLPFFRMSNDGEEPWDWKDVMYPVCLGLIFAGGWYATRIGRIHSSIYLSILPDAVLFGALLLFRKRRLRFALGYAVVLIGYAVTASTYIEDGQRIFVARDFFGVKKVLFDPKEKLRKLIHGEIVHGVESVEPLRSGIPLSYYHPTGPVGDVMALLDERTEQTVGVVGLGTGSVGAYAGANRHVTFFDIDPQVESIARTYFTYLGRCGPNCNVVIGDGRLSIEQTADRTFDLLLLDAFSSDSIPAHLVSREALEVYRARLKPNGLLLFHVSNRYLNVAGLVSAVTTGAGLVVYMRSDRAETVPGKSGSDYIVAARYLLDLGVLPIKGTWQRVPPNKGIRPWTDDYSNMLSLLRWGS